jgi:hypothetical protein
MCIWHCDVVDKMMNRFELQAMSIFLKTHNFKRLRYDFVKCLIAF